MTSELLPEPETPVTHVIVPSGISTVDVLAGCARARRAPRGSSRCRRAAAPAIGMASVPGEVAARERRRRSPSPPRACPRRRSRPPWRPAPGPMSITWSAASIVSRSCSTTSTVLPRSRSRCERREQPRRCRADAARSTARRGCRARPRGSSRSGSRAGCAAPRRPRASRSCGRASGSRGRPATQEAEPRRGSPSGAAARSRAPAPAELERREERARRRRPRGATPRRCVLPPTRTARLSLRSRAPSQPVHGRALMRPSSSSRSHGDSRRLRSGARRTRPDPPRPA